MWQRIKAGADRVAVWVFIHTLPAVVRVDVTLVYAYQRFIADPLQTRGFRLIWQARTWMGLAAFFITFQRPFSLLFLPVGMFWLAQAFFEKNSHLESDADEAPMLNFRKLFIPHIYLRICVILWSTMMLTWSYSPAWLCFVLHHYASACEPKPPRPKRLKVLVPSEGGV